MKTAEEWNHVLFESELEDRSFEPVIAQIQADALRHAAKLLEDAHQGYYFGAIVELADQLDSKLKGKL